jgi:glyoxylase-like metal-dependent hydrolase (beta-lactamase superfamily II)
VSGPAVALPAGVRLVRADNPGPMTLDGTNTWVLDGPEGALVVDPGPSLAEHREAVLAAAGGRVACVLLTHRHADHAEDAAALGRAAGAPVRATDPAFCAHGGAALRPGEQVGPLTVLPTPGHTSDSTCFVHRRGGGDVAAVLTGDTVLGRGTTVVAHPDGRLDAYLGSLEALATLAGAEGDCAVLPGHGPVLPSLADAAARYRAHRAERLEAVRAAVAEGRTTPRAVVESVYADVPREVWPAAEASVAAQLLFLRVSLEVPPGAPPEGATGGSP